MCSFFFCMPGSILSLLDIIQKSNNLDICFASNLPTHVATCSRISSMAPYPPGLHTQGNRIDRRKIFRRVITPGNEIAIFFNISRQLVRWRIGGYHIPHTDETDEIAPVPIPIQIEGDPEYRL